MSAQARQPRLWPILLATLIGTAILVTLGVWQVQRLQWKEALLAQLAANAAATPIDLATAAARAAAGEDMEFVRVSFPATYRHEGMIKMLATYQGGQGWTIITPATSSDGFAVIVDRGRIPDQQLDGFEKPGGLVQIDGVLRGYGRGRAMFDPDNDARANLWYWWDVPAMLAAGGLAPELKPFPFVVQLLPAAAAAAFPRPEESKAKLANNHLGYAITWFGLAATLLAVAGVYLSGLRKTRRA
jgi:surfeit locus 1 family protein